MSAKALAILQKKTTKPKSRLEVQKYLVARHGKVVRENASADLTALDERALKSIGLQTKRLKIRAV